MTRIYFCKLLLLITFCDSAVLRYLAMTYFPQSRKVTNIHHIEHTPSELDSYVTFEHY